MNTDNIKQLIQNLRRGDDIEKSRTQFFDEIKTNTGHWCQTLSLRWLVSVVDTYADHGSAIEQSNAMIVSTFFNLVKMADTAKLLTMPSTHMLLLLQNDVVALYDEVNSLKITDDDMPNILFFRIDKKLQRTPVIHAFFNEIKKRLAQHSPTLTTLSQYHKGFYNLIFFEGRRHFLQPKQQNNE